ncbi:MAG: membrane protein insertase YidC [Candidatus Omnitrophica bacterium]|nr:membrane protein insertase YidC [Candidatus Omnitrophota bacterium]MDD5238594.1 membrane protein insertase YidC [Candidatus Omnitrophota bacterium]
MEKRVILAIALSLLVLISWSALTSKVYHIENKEVTNVQPLSVKPAPKQIPILAPTQESASLPTFQYAQNNFEVSFIEPWAAIKEVVFKAHQDYKFSLKYAFLLTDKSLNFKRENASSPEEVVFTAADRDKKITKIFTFHNASYSIDLDIVIENLTNAPLEINLPLILGVQDFSSNNMHSRDQGIAIAKKDKIQHLQARKDLSLDEVKFIALRDRYFSLIVEPESNNLTGFIHKINSESEIGLNLQNLILSPGQHLEQKFHIYLGPQELKTINKIKPAWGAIVNYGTFDFIGQILWQLLEFLHRLVPNWGWAIVIFSLLVYFLLYPLSLKQMRSIKEMQALQPKIEELRKTYKDNPQKLNKEILELYRQHKVNPFGGCLPLILQMPIFFALYQVLMRSVALKGANFLWIKDLSEPDRLFILPVSLPLLGNEINILPIAMTIIMFVQQKLSTVSASSGSAEQQKLMMIIFPLMFGFIFYRMPSGLVLYWFINSALMLFYYFLMHKKDGQQN